MRDGHEWKYVVPQKDRLRVLRESHDSPQAAHLGIDKTYARVLQNYFWPGMFVDVIRHVKNCVTCQAIKVSQTKPVGFLGERIIEHPWTVVAADIMGPLPRSRSGFSYLLVIQDLFTKWVELAPLRAAKGKNIRQKLDELVLTRWGRPRVFHSDNGKEFKNNAIEEYANENNIHFSLIPPYRPQANPVERVNRVLKTMIAAYVDQDHKTWDAHVEDFRFAYNTARHAATKMTPAFLNLGRELEPRTSLRREIEGEVEIEPASPQEWIDRLSRVGNIRDWIVDNLEKAHARQAPHYNLRRRQLAYKLQDRVWVRHRPLSKKADGFAAKLAPKYKGPYTVIKVTSPLVYVVKFTDGRTKAAYVNDLKPYRHGNDPELE